MLTGDLVRLRIRGQSVVPGYLKLTPKMHEKAAAILEVIAAHEGRTKGELDDALKVATGQGNDFKILRGLAKLVLDKVDIGVDTPLDPSEVRQTVFALAAPRHPVSAAERAEVMAEAAAQLGSTAEALEEALFADLAANQRVGVCPEMTPEALLHRYNVALAQAVVLRARWLAVDLYQPKTKRLRQLIRHLKFHRLMYDVTKTAAGLRFRIDGPTSIVSRSTRYGLQLANFLPALLLHERWRLEAEYEPKKGKRTATFVLEPDDGLKTHYRDTGTWIADEEKALLARLKELAAPWTVSAAARLIDLDGRGHLVPDVVLTDPATKRQAFIEVIWRWRKSGLQARYDLLAEAGPKNLVLAICTADERDLPDLPGEIYTFRGLPNAKKLLKLAMTAAED